MGLSPKKRAALYGMFGMRCAYCGNILQETGWQADHVVPCSRKLEVVRENGRAVIVNGRYKYRFTGEFWNPDANRDDNYFPACRSCNISKSNVDLESWRRWLQDRPVQLRKNTSDFKHAERFGLVTVIDMPIVFHFEKYRAELAVANKDGE
jgi:5-methylcytosine-specific restriction endonuclease McrA